MAVRTEYAPGTFSWVDLSTTDTAAAKDFYAKLFGWEYQENPTDAGGTYIMASLGGKSVAGLFELSQEMKDQGIPPHWSSYITVENADEIGKVITDAGGTVVAPAFDVMTAGRMTIALDPEGAKFAMWQPKEHIGCERVNEHGTLCWNELMCDNPEGTAAFYEKVFGWTTKTSPMGDMGSYTSILVGERPNGGMMKKPPPAAQMPTVWMTYFAVNDLDESLGQLGKLGGNIVMPAMAVPEVGRICLVSDPQGVHFYLIQLDSPADLSS